MKNNIELIARTLTKYVNNQARHVQQVLPWIGFILTAIRNLPGVDFDINRVRQLWFAYRGRYFKVRYSHRFKQCGFCRGGIEILEWLHGNRDGRVVVRIKDITDAEHLYRTLQADLDRLIATA